jgi:hypothetical protein
MAAIWKQEKATALYILSFGIYLGFFIGPALAYNFTSKHYSKLLHESGNETIEGFVRADEDLTNGTNVTDTHIPDPAVIQWRLFILFSMIAAEVAIFGTLTFIACLCLGLEKLQLPKEDMEGNHKVLANPWIAWFLLMIAGLVQFIGDGQVNSTVGSYLKSYVMLYMDLSKSKATIIALSFNGTYAAWACLGAFVQRWLGPTCSFFIMAQSNIIGTAIMYIWGKEFIPFCIGIAFLGVGLSAKSSALICWVTEKVGKVAHVTCVTYVAWALGDMVQATLIGNLFDNNPHTFVLVLFGGSCIFYLSFIVGQLGYMYMMKEPEDPICSLERNGYKQME